jgi:uncharacterized protein
MDWYRNHTVLITGASGGIGEAMARLLAPTPGVTLLLTARSGARLDRLAEEFRQRGARVETFPLDLARAGAAHALFEQVETAGHAVDVLVNNAGYGLGGAVVEQEAEAYEDMLTLNVTNLVALTRLVLPGMLARGRGGVLNVASTAGYQPIPYLAVYAASKAFVRAFTSGLHAELRDTGVHATCLAPGPTDTRFLERADMSAMPSGFASASPERVARDGLRALAANRRMKVSGRWNGAVALAAHFTPTRIVLRVGARLMQRTG